MKHFLVRFVTALAAFAVGLAVEFCLFDQHFARRPIPQRTTPAASSVSGPPAPLTSEPEAPGFVFDYDPEGFNPRGDYYIVGRKPQGFRDFDCLEVAVDDDEATGSVRLYTYANQSYTSHTVVSGSLTSDRLTFVASPASHSGGEFVYSLEGRFTRSGTVSEAPHKAVVLAGRLTKSKGGVKVADRWVKFHVEYLGC